MATERTCARVITRVAVFICATSALLHITKNTAPTAKVLYPASHLFTGYALQPPPISRVAFLYAYLPSSLAPIACFQVKPSAGVSSAPVAALNNWALAVAGIRVTAVCRYGLGGFFKQSYLQLWPQDENKVPHLK